MDLNAGFSYTVLRFIYLGWKTRMFNSAPEACVV
jgi:hypothetical protein